PTLFRSVRTRGLTRSTCDGPRRHERQVPNFSFFASIPQLLYIDTSQSCAPRTLGEPVRRGPMESIRLKASCWTRELSMPTDQMWLRTGLVVCASTAGVVTARARRIPMRRFIELVLVDYHSQQRVLRARYRGWLRVPRRPGKSLYPADAV